LAEDSGPHRPLYRANAAVTSTSSKNPAPKTPCGGEHQPAVDPERLRKTASAHARHTPGTRALIQILYAGPIGLPHAGSGGDRQTWHSLFRANFHRHRRCESKRSSPPATILHRPEILSRSRASTDHSDVFIFVNSPAVVLIGRALGCRRNQEVCLHLLNFVLPTAMAADASLANVGPERRLRDFFGHLGTGRRRCRPTTPHAPDRR